MKIAIVIPAYQSEKTISTLLTEIEKNISKLYYEFNIIVVDDGSLDKTEEVIQKFNITYLRHKSNLGKGEALKTGFRHAINNNFDAVITLDSDLQHDPKYIQKFIQQFQKDKLDLLIGDRVNRFKKMPIQRQLSNIITSFLISAKTKIKIDDSQSGFRMISTRLLKSISLSESGFMLETEVILNAAKQKFKIGSIPISTIYSNRNSHMKTWKSISEFVKLIISD